MRLLPFLTTASCLASLSSSKRRATGDGGGELCVSQRCLPKDYKRLELPMPNRVNRVNMSMEVLDVLRIDDKKFSVTVNMYFGVVWTEDRMIVKTGAPEAEWLPIDLEFMKHMWMPNVFVYNLVSFDALECLEKLAGMWIKKGKTFVYNQATHVTFMCPMRFNRFPMDEHTCKFRVGSTSFNDQLMRFYEETLSYDGSKGNTILDYQVSISSLAPADTVEPYGSAGNFSVTGFQMRLSRNVAKYLYIYYLPSGLFVVVSWVSFLIPPEVVPGRMALLVTLFLVLTNIFNTITNVSPNAEGMTAIASWMIACMFFVFGALMGYAAILYFLKVKKQASIRKKQSNFFTVHAKTCMMHPSSEAVTRKEELQSLYQGERLAKVDTYFLYAFPVAFLVFNIVYWPYWTVVVTE